MGSEAAPQARIGTIVWQDLTVPNAESVRRFYESVIGWESRPEPMGGYEDYYMQVPETGDSITGICHARGVNADVPPVWLVYFAVADVRQSAARCRELGGEILVEPRAMGDSLFCVLRDPAGAICALYGPGEASHAAPS